MRQICSSVPLLRLVPLAFVIHIQRLTEICIHICCRIKYVLHLITMQIPVVSVCLLHIQHCVLMRGERMDFTHLVGHAAC